MTAFFRPPVAITAVIASFFAAASAADATPMVHPSAGGAPSNLVKAHYDGEGYWYHDRYYHGRHVVHAPFTRVETGRRTVVDAPFVHVFSGRHGNHIVAPFVDLWR
jgi:hypothetical protein